MKPSLLTSDLPADVTGWWVSEKYDGVRAIWNGEKLLSRNGKDLKAPVSFTSGLPKDVRLDGELWMGRGTFDQLVSVIQTKGSDWAGVLYMVFDMASPGPVFETRMAALLTIPLHFPHYRVTHRKLGRIPKLYKSSNHELAELEKTIVRAGGEGCVIRRPGSLYRPGRVGDVIKVKRLVADIDRWQG